MKNKKLWIAVLAVIVVVAVGLGIYVATRPATSEGAKTVTVDVVHGDGTAKTFTYHTDEAYLGPVLVKEGLVQGTDSDYGLMIDTVDGETAVWETDNAYWALYIGDDYASTGADQTPVHDGDRFRLEYTRG